MQIINGVTYYEAGETARKLNCTIAMLGYYRREKRIEGTRVGMTTLYTEEAIANADFSPKKTGPKPKQSNHLEMSVPA